MGSGIQAIGPYRKSPVAGVRTLGIHFFEWFGELAVFWSRVLSAMLAPPWEFRELIRQCDSIGSGSLPLVALAGAATGVVISLQTQESLAQFGFQSLFPAVIMFPL